LLGNVGIQSAISEAQKKRSERTNITADRVLEELAKIGFLNMQDYITVQGDGTAYIDLSTLTREQAAAIQEITVDEYTEGRGEDARDVRKVKVKLYDKKSALDSIGKHLGMFVDKHELSGVVSVMFGGEEALQDEEES
jgi:phage terminase small subunit